jgi:hypothetical protein
MIAHTASFNKTFYAVTLGQIRGGTLIVAETDVNGTVIGDYTGNCTISLHGTNPTLTAIHGGPRETPNVVRGKEGVVLSSGMLGVMGTLIMRGQKVGHSWALLDATAEKGSVRVVLDRRVTWNVGHEILIR